MSIKNISGERFQLLTTFKAIYNNGGISAAADVQGITQSAASKHLQKLRDWFEEELFVRTANGMEPTEKASTLIERVEHILTEMEALNQASHFSPAQLKGVFTIATTSEVCKRLVPPLLEIMSKEAPDLRITVINLANDYSIRELEMGKVSVVISVNWHTPEQLMQKRLFSDRFVCLMNKNHALAKRPLTLKNYAEASHIMVAPLGKERGFIDDQLSLHGLRRRVRLSVPDFSQLGAQLLDHEHIITLPHRIALEMRKDHDLTIKQLPIAVPSFDYYLFWHLRFQEEHTNKWMRDKIYNVLKI